MLNEQLAARIQAGVDEADNMLLLWQQNEPFIRIMSALVYSIRNTSVATITASC